MIQIDNKFDIGQEVYMIGRQCRVSSNGKKTFKWIVKTKKNKPLDIFCIYYRYKLMGENELRYLIENHGKVAEDKLFFRL